MRAMAITAYGEPLVGIEMPEPEVPPGFVLLEILTCGVCFSDVKTARGNMPYSDRLSLPHVPGHEVFGRVVSSEPAGLLATGTHAIVFHYWPCGRCAACRRGDETLCRDLAAWMGFTDAGGFRERIAVPVDRLVPVPASLDPIHAAPMSCALGTAYRSVVTRGGVRAGSHVAIVGLGGVGIHAAQIARASGGRAVGFDVHEPTLEAARSLGLDARRSDDEASVDLLAETDGEGVDVVVDTVGHEDAFGLALSLVRPGGRIVGVGYSPSSEVRVPTPRFVLDELDLVGSKYAHRDDLERAVALVAQGLVTTVVGMVRPLDEVNEVIEAVEAGEVVGRGVLDVAGVT
jgi:propanol-preferring alcohol dehydrogenase